MNFAGEVRERAAIAAFLSLRSEESFQGLFQVLYPRMHRHFLARGLDGGAAEELAQNVMFLVYRHVAQLRDQPSFYGWLFRIARNEYLQYARRNCSGIATVEYEPLSAWLAETIPAPGAARESGALAGWLAHLEPTEREILMLHFAEDLGYREIAAALGIPVGTVKWKAFVARAKLSELLRTEAGRTE